MFHSPILKVIISKSSMILDHCAMVHRRVHIMHAMFIHFISNIQVSEMAVCVCPKL